MPARRDKLCHVEWPQLVGKIAGFPRDEIFHKDSIEVETSGAALSADGASVAIVLCCWGHGACRGMGFAAGFEDVFHTVR